MRVAIISILTALITCAGYVGVLVWKTRSEFRNMIVAFIEIEERISKTNRALNGLTFRLNKIEDVTRIK